MMTPDRVRQTAGHIFAETEHLADFADGAARAVMDHRRGQGGAAMAIASIDILDDFLAPLMLEIHIDVGRLAAFGAEEALEQDIDLGGIDGGHIQRITDHGIGGGAAPLAKDSLAPRKGDDVADGEEIMRDFPVGDEAQFLFGKFRDMRRNAVRKMPFQSCFGEVAQMAVRRLAPGHRFARIALAQFRQGECDGPGKMQGLGDGFGAMAEQPRHLRRRFQMPLGIGLQARAGRLQCHMFADAGDDILQVALAGDRGKAHR